jgi:hypothetical protein
LIEIDVKAFTLFDRGGLFSHVQFPRDARRHGHLVASIHAAESEPLPLAGPGALVGSPDGATFLESFVLHSELEMAGGLSR